MFFRRGLGDAPDPWLSVKLWLFGVGAILALLGMAFENDAFIAGAAVALGLGVLLRFLPRPGGSDDAGADVDGAEADGAEADGPGADLSGPAPPDPGGSRTPRR